MIPFNGQAGVVPYVPYECSPKNKMHPLKKIEFFKKGIAASKKHKQPYFSKNYGLCTHTRPDYPWCPYTKNSIEASIWWLGFNRGILRVTVNGRVLKVSADG